MKKNEIKLGGNLNSRVLTLDAVTNSIGSNTFNILICLGLPWMIKAIQTGVEEDKWIVKVQSDALTYTVIKLMRRLTTV